MSQALKKMSNAEAIEIVRNGGRIQNEHTRFVTQLKDCPTGYCHQYRVIVCDDPTDIVECSKCGHQALAKCDFDNDFA